MEEKRQEVNHSKAVAFHHSLILGKKFNTWRAYARLMTAKNKLRAMEVQKDRSRQKISSFLKKIDSLKELEMPRRSASAKVTPSRAPLTPKRPELSKIMTTVKKTPKELKRHQEKVDIQKQIIENQRERLKKQQKEIDDLKEMKMQIELGRPVTNKAMLKMVNQSIPPPPCQTPENQFAMLPKDIEASDLLDLRSKEFKALLDRSVKAAADAQKSSKNLRNIIVDKNLLEREKRPKSVGGDFYYSCEADDDGEALETQFSRLKVIVEPKFPIQDQNDVASKKAEDKPEFKISPDPDFLINIKLRQQERERKREQIRRFHRTKADEKMRLKMEKEANELRAEKEERERQGQSLKSGLQIKHFLLFSIRLKEERKELRKKIRQREKVKKERRDQLLQFGQKAHDFYHNVWLPKHFGFLPWKRLMKDYRLKVCVAELHHVRLMKKNYFQLWIKNARQSSYEYTLQTSKATVHYFHQILRKTVRTWHAVLLDVAVKMKKAQDLHEENIKKRVLTSWMDLVERENRERRSKAKRADQCFHLRLKKEGMKRWIRFIKERDVIAGREALKLRLENKIRLDIPDYVPFSVRASTSKLAMSKTQFNLAS